MQQSEGKSLLLSSSSLSSRTGLRFSSLSVGLVVKPNRVHDAHAGVNETGSNGINWKLVLSKNQNNWVLEINRRVVGDVVQKGLNSCVDITRIHGLKSQMAHCFVRVLGGPD